MKKFQGPDDVLLLNWKLFLIFTLTARFNAWPSPSVDWLSN